MNAWMKQFRFTEKSRIWHGLEILNYYLIIQSSIYSRGGVERSPRMRAGDRGSIPGRDRLSVSFTAKRSATGVSVTSPRRWPL